MFGERLRRADRIAAKRYRRLLSWAYKPPEWGPGRYRKMNMTCQCQGCHHRRSGRFYKAKGDHKRRWVFLLGEV